MMFDLLWNLHQQRRIAGLESQVSHAGRKAERGVEELEQRVETLILANMAMWSILKDRLGVTDEQLAQRVKEIDLMDGKLDGRAGGGAAGANAATGNVIRCSACQRAMPARHKVCMYCGGQPDRTSVFPVA